VDLKKHGIRPLSVEGQKEGHWILLDYGHVIIHVFYEPVRSFYDLEGLWIDAKRIDTKNILHTNSEKLKTDLTV
jgi:ribosome-associated protein